MDYLSCAFTGHRPSRFCFRYNEKHPLCVRIKEAILEQSKNLYVHGIRRFYVGGALGVDMWAGEAILSLKALQEYPGIELICVIPFEGYNNQWDDFSCQRLEKIFAACDERIVVSSANDSKAYKARNYYMVDNAQFLTAVYDYVRCIPSGTGQTIRYAKKRNRAIIFIHPDTAKVEFHPNKYKIRNRET